MEIEIRRAEPSEAEELALVETQSHMNDSSITQPHRFRLEGYIKLLADGADVFVLIADDRISAICIVLNCKDDGYLGWADIVEICVLPETRGMGFAKRLISFSLEEMRKKGFKNAYLRTLGGVEEGFETETVCLMESLGFVAEYSEPDHEGIYEIIFTKELNQ